MLVLTYILRIYPCLFNIHIKKYNIFGTDNVNLLFQALKNIANMMKKLLLTLVSAAALFTTSAAQEKTTLSAELPLQFPLTEHG